MAGEGRNICLGGGLAYNALLIQSIEDSGRFQNVWVQPVAGNAGTSFGSALFALHQSQSNAERHVLRNLFLGEKYGSEEIKRVLENCKLRFGYHRTENEMVKATVQRLTDNKIVAWFQGRTEFGPRALGNRSILASPLNPYSTQNLNEYIKHREPFRKFAASVPEELASQYFEVSDNARFLATVSRVKASHRETFDSALLDGDRIRVHVVCREDNQRFWSSCRPWGMRVGFPLSTTRRSTSSGIHWSRILAQQFEVSTLRESMPSSSGTFSSRKGRARRAREDDESIGNRNDRIPATLLH